jgi:hypothetical protein
MTLPAFSFASVGCELIRRIVESVGIGCERGAPRADPFRCGGGCDDVHEP